MKFKGIDNPEVYLIDFHQDENSDQEEYPFSGPRGNFLMSLIGSYGLLAKIRCGNCTVQGKDVVEEDIIRTSPKILVAFGSEALKAYYPTNRKITDMSGQIVSIKIKDVEYPCLIMMSPNYVLHRLADQSVSLKFSKDLYKALQYTIGEYRDVLKEKTILSAYTYQEFLDIYHKYFENDIDISYDIETNARPPMYRGSEIIGFSIANKQTGVFVCTKALDYTMPTEDEKAVWDFLIKDVFEKKNKLIIHNTMYERPYTLYCKGYEIGIDKADDTLVMARLLRNPKESAGLKYQAQKYIAYPDWETDLTNYISGFTSLVKRLGLGPKKYKDLYDDIINSRNSICYIPNSPYYAKLSQLDKDEIQNILDLILIPIKDLYTEEEVIKIGTLISEKVKEAVDQGGIKDSTIPYNWIPYKVLSKYGAVDSLATYDLRDYFFQIMDDESTENVDLHKGYRNWLEHIYVAYIMERNGLYWNDELASKDREFLEAQATSCLKYLLQSPLFAPYISRTTGDVFKPIILSDYMPQIAQCQGFEVDYDQTSDDYTIKKDGKKIRKGSINDIEILDCFQDSYNTFLKLLFDESIKSATGFEELKDLYNPSSSSESDIAMGILVTPNLQLCHKIITLATIATSPEFEGKIDKFPFIDRKFLQIAELIVNEDKLKDQFGDEWAVKRKALYDGFISFYHSQKDKITTKEVKEALGSVFEVNSLDDEGIIAVYNCLRVTGIDKDNPSTWTEQFTWLMNYRLFKKSFKLLSSYIDGSVGRGSVAIVKKSELESGSHTIERITDYYSRTPLSDEAYLLNTSWFPNTAETGRWRSSVHTIPAGSQVKKYYTSRFKGGTMLMPDYSQMEVRSLAGVSHDENMLNLFKSGADFHTETAKKIFRKEEVTPAERRFSKAATFALLYGAAETTFAKNYCKGDLTMAHQIYEGFFTAYPKVEEWIEERHQEVQHDHRVSLDLANRFIKINQEGDGKGAIGAMMRKAQNYPIQATSADLTGCVVFDIQKFIEENNLKSLIVMYVHDSIEVDVPPFELIKVISTLKNILIDSPQKRMGLPSKADVALGYSLGHEIDMEDIQTNEDYTECTVSLKGYKDEIDETVNNWKTVYSMVEMTEESWKDIFVSMGELFIAKKAYTPTLGTHRKKGTCKVHIKY